MAKVKMSKKSMRVDMTAMCDVSFLLLTFFVLTSTAKLPEALPVDTPASTVQTKLPETNLATLTVGGGRVFFGVLGKENRKETLTQMGQKYNIDFTEKEKDEFSNIEGVGTPITALKQFLNLPHDVRNKAVQTGIPTDSLDNQLKDWVQSARVAVRDLDNKVLDVAIKGDAKEEYPTIKRVIDILQDQKVNRFFLVTGLRNEDF
ncbi:biopolymer transporter ExbD [Flavobacterium sp. NKUCC04_CG]|uniref:ExbD/TolR family protein n=1 Tax=Flavobacterium sp. NKUCC04_CG TaxID=2842121 RepID=UPI001C5AA0CE|nr:biopolymer transporter ExbD [Flavobacterium sp. NKUCC04_CG]MBW3518122.1 biopolymer transporter ExbD [Flavobacterium sp. NKUCC04_CG]